jgi:small subunit ribosomal protein S13
LTDEKKKIDKKAEDDLKEQKEKPGKKSKPIFEDTAGGTLSEDQKEKVTDALSEGEKPEVDSVNEPILKPSTKKDELGEESLKEKSEEKPFTSPESSDEKTPKDLSGKESDTDASSEKEEIIDTIEEPLKEIYSEESSEKTVQPLETKEKELNQKEIPGKGKHIEKKSSKKKGEDDEDFQYIIRIANTDIDGNKTVVMGLAQIKGIGRHMATLIVDATGIDKKIKIGKLTEPQIEKIKNVLEDIQNIAPGWMLNHRKDNDTGEDIHLISSDVDLRLRDDVNLLKMIRSYRGIRHESGLSVRGQRTRANNRRGLALGVSKKRPGT